MGGCRQSCAQRVTMSKWITVTYVCFTQEFQLVGSDQQLLAKVRDYFGVEGGGLALNGTGPVVNEYHDGCAYELVGAVESFRERSDRSGKSKKGGGASAASEGPRRIAKTVILSDPTSEARKLLETQRAKVNTGLMWVFTALLLFAFGYLVFVLYPLQLHVSMLKDETARDAFNLQWGHSLTVMLASSLLFAILAVFHDDTYMSGTKKSVEGKKKLQ